uniref:NR LBD domain-containing protein n=1 Tax=Caenorhabditis tropicalis TaxID=1561998 RepID=A0A1I7T6J9_9PELO
MGSHGNYQLTSCYLFGDPSISELVKDKIDWKLEPRPQNYQMSCMDWGFISGIVSIDFISKFPFINSLELKDKAILYRQCFFFSSLLFDSLRASKKKQDFVCFPDGTEVIQLNAPGVTKHFENNIRSRLAGRANELRITREEVLLLSVIMLCNPSESLFFYSNPYKNFQAYLIYLKLHNTIWQNIKESIPQLFFNTAFSTIKNPVLLDSQICFPYSMSL